MARSLYLSALSLLLACATAAAQEPSQTELKRLRAERLGKPVFAKNGWLTDYAAAQQKAKADDKVLFVYFTRSHRPCAPCDVVENGLLAEDRFASFARGVIPVVHVNSHCDDEPRPRLHAEFGLQSYPAFAFVDPDGTLLARPPAETIDAFAATLVKVDELRALRHKATAGGTTTKAREFVLEADLGRLSIQQLEAGLAAHQDLPAADRERITMALTDARLDALAATARQLGETELLARVGAIAKSGGRPSEARAPQFWAQALAFAANTKDTTLAAQAFAELEARFGKDPHKSRQLRAWRELRDRAKGS